MKILNISLIQVLCLITLCFVVTIDAKERPNAVMVVVDDLGWADVGYNNPDSIFNTSNIDELARNSMHFTNAYAGAANCAPSRAVLMSGQYTPRHGIYTVSPATRGHEKTRKLIPSQNKDVLDDNNVTLAEMFKAKGYQTGHFGKWHLGEDPSTQGFDHNVAGHKKGHPKTYFSPYNLPFIENGSKGEYLTDRLTTEVVDWITQNKEKPFFAYVPYYSVHTPLQAIEDVKQKYLNHPLARNEKHATYAAMVEIMDKNVGRIRDTLRQHNLTENTLLIFTSDNGGIRSISYQDPLRAGKGSYYEGGIRVPLLVSWPTKVKPGTNHTPTINADFYPTFGNVLKVSKLPQTLDGEDLSPLLFEQGTLPERALFWHFPIYLQAYNLKADQSQDPLFRTRPGSAMRRGKWKLIHYFEEDEYELYDLENDLGEHVNFASYLPDIVKTMSSELKQWQTRIKAPIPTQKNVQYDREFELKKMQSRLLAQ